MLKRGSTGPEVRSWQAFLSIQGLAPGLADGTFGGQTEAATRGYQSANRLIADGVVGPATYSLAHKAGWRVTGDGPYPLVPARWFTTAARGVGDIGLVVIHTTEGPEIPRRAEAVANYFATTARASAHYTVDPVMIVQSVLERDVAWGAGKANARGIHIEHCGRAGQTAEEWADDTSRAELALSARLVADICHRHNIPVEWLSAEMVKGGARGITGHKQCSDAFGGSHWDPGPNFPIASYLAAVRAEMDK